MSTQLLDPKLIKTAVSALYDVKSSDLSSGPASRLLSSSVESLFDTASTIDKHKNKHPQQNLFYLLWKANAISVDNMVESGVMSQAAKDGMMGDAATYQKTGHEQLSLLSQQKSPGFLVDNQQSMTMLAGMFENVAYHIDEGSVPDSVKRNLSDVSSHLKAYALSLDPDYPEVPYDGDFQPVAQTLLTLANNGEQLYDAYRAVTNLMMDKFEFHGTYESGMARTYWGSDVTTTIIKDLVEGSGVVHVPVESVPSDIRLPSLSSLSGLEINIASDIPVPSEETRSHLTSILHHANEAMKDATLVDYNGNKITDNDYVEKIKDSFSRGVRALDDATISRFKEYGKGYSYHVKEPDTSELTP